MNKYIIITTINEKTEAIEKLEEYKDWNIIIIGDKKSKHIKSGENLIYLSLEDQSKLGFEYEKICPENHYARKNIGYLFAIKNGAEIIYDTDDDNIPKQNWAIPSNTCNNNLRSNNKFVNIYKYFSEENIWPRGFPLDEINKPDDFELLKTDTKEIGVWQGLSDNEPDVDAIYRLTVDKKIVFNNRDAIYLEKNCFCPSNSQNTFWQKKAFPALYLPSTVSFRFTDILRGYIAQFILWKLDMVLGFTSATNLQDRNVHNLMKDFEEELECYLNIKQIIKAIESTKIKERTFLLKDIYKNLVNAHFVEKKELMLIESWERDLERIKRNKLYR